MHSCKKKIKTPQKCNTREVGLLSAGNSALIPVSTMQGLEMLLT